eukprot:g1818.t1
MENIVFGWATKLEQGQIESKNMQFRRNIEHTTARVIGALSRGRMEAVSAIFFKEISSLLSKQDLTHRPAFMSLCDSMKYIKLSFSTENDFAASLNLIHHADPLKHAATIKPSQARHCLSIMMSCWLHPMAESGVITQPPFNADNISVQSSEHRVPEGLRNQFFNQIDTMQESLRQWAEEKNKHTPDVYPLIVDLWCIQKRNHFLERGDKVLKMLKKAIKTKEYRCIAIRCMIQCARIALYRLESKTEESSGRSKIHEWRNRIAGDVLLNIKKTANPSNELQDLVARLCVTIGHFRPLFVFDSMIVPLMQHEQADKTAIALKALLELMFMAVSGTKTTSSTKDLPNVRDQLVSLERNERDLLLLQYIRSGESVLTLLKLEDRKDRIAEKLSKCFQFFETMMGTGTTMMKGSMSADATRELLPMFTMLAWGIRCIPYVLPSVWTTTELLDNLARYTCHAEPMISSVAIRSLKNILIGMPKWRNEVLHRLASFIVSIPDENTNSIKDGLRNLHDLLKEWSNLANDSMESNGSPPSNVFKVQPLEGLVLCFFCSAIPEIRKIAFEILTMIRSLHQSLLQSKENVNLSPSDIGSTESPFTTVMYVMDVLEEMGSDIAQRIYWDFGPWSDLYRRWNRAKDTVTLSEIMYGAHSTLSVQEKNRMTIRWARCLSELAIEAYGLCPIAFEAAYVEVTKKIQLITKPENAGRNTIETTTDPVVIDHFRNYCSFACGCPPIKRTESGGGTLSVHNLHHLMVSLLNSGLNCIQSIGVSALGNCHPKSYDVLAKEMQNLMNPEQSKERPRSKQVLKSKAEDLRLNTANVLRLVADRMPKGTLIYKRGLKQRFLEAIDQMMNSIRPGVGPVSIFDSISQLPTDYAMQDMLQLCYCLCSILANAAAELSVISGTGTEGMNVKLRRILFEICQQWNAPGSSLVDFISSKAQLLHSVPSRSKDIDSAGKSANEMEKLCKMLEVSSRLAMVSLLQGPPWETDRRTNSPVFTWIDYMLTQDDPQEAFAPSNASIARQALLKMIISNITLLDGCINKSYHANQQIASVYFQVVSEVYCSYEVKVPVHVIISLVLYKCVDPDRHVREDALHLLKCVAHREWQGKCTTGWALCFNGHSMEDNVVVIGNLQDTCQSFQYQLSESLAREHPEINEKLCEELMTMQCNEVVNQGVLLCLTPWMERLSFCPGDTEFGDRLLKSMYYITSQHGKHFSHEIERLWSTIANSKHNVRPILDFLVGFGVKEYALQDEDLLLEYFSVLKRICLYLARTSPHRTIDHLVCEAGKLIRCSTPVSYERLKDEASSSSPLRFSSMSSTESSVCKLKSESSLSLIQQREGSLTRISETTKGRVPSFSSNSYTEPIIVLHRDRTRPTNISLSMQSDGSFEESSSSVHRFEGIGQSSRKSFSNISVVGSERRGSETVVVSGPKGLLQREDIAICLLSEIAFEQGDKFSNHLPLLFHICIICMDSLEPVVRLHCQQLVIHLLNVLMSKRVGIPGKATKLSSLVLALQSMKGQAPWPYEDTDLNDGEVLSEDSISFFVSGLLEATREGSNLKELWIKEALTWAIEGLTPHASSEAFISLVRCLKECFTTPSLTAMECILEILETMKMQMYNADGAKLVLYPQLFWVCISLLSSDYVHIYRLALELLYRLLDSVSISNDINLNVLLATTPTSIKYSPAIYPDRGACPEDQDPLGNKTNVKELKAWDLGTQILLPMSEGHQNPILCIQQLLIKGLYSDQTESITIKLMSRISGELILTPEVNLNSSTYMNEPRPRTRENSGVSVLLGSVYMQITVSLASLIPWTCSKITNHSEDINELKDGVLEICQTLTEACSSEGYNTVATAFSDLTRADQEGLPLTLAKLADALYQEIPYEAASLMIGYWLGLLQSKEQGIIHISLMLLRAIFERYNNPSTKDYQHPSLCVLSDSDVFSMISVHLQGPNSMEASKVLSAMVSCSSKLQKMRTQRLRDEDRIEILIDAMRLGMNLHELVSSDHSHIEKTILGVLETCPQHLKKPSGREFMPFLRQTNGQVEEKNL